MSLEWWFPPCIIRIFASSRRQHYSLDAQHMPAIPTAFRGWSEALEIRENYFFNVWICNYNFWRVKLILFISSSDSFADWFSYWGRAKCPPGWRMFDHHCYHFSSDSDIRSWQSAEMACNNLYDSHLVSIQSMEENDFIGGQTIDCIWKFLLTADDTFHCI